MKNGEISVQGRDATVSLSLIAVACIGWATFVTVQLFQIREEIASLKAFVHQNNFASTK